jgi:hypothetical protein
MTIVWTYKRKGKEYVYKREIKNTELDEQG